MLAHWKKTYDQTRQLIKKQRHYFDNKSLSVKDMGFPIIMYGCESWIIKKAEWWRIDAFELWCWRRLLRVPWSASRSNQSILKEIKPEYSLEGLMLNLKLQYFGYVMRRTESLEKTLMLGKIECGRKRGLLRMRWFDGITDLMDWVWRTSGVGDGQGGLVCCNPGVCKELVMTEWLYWLKHKEEIGKATSLADCCDERWSNCIYVVYLIFP